MGEINLVDAGIHYSLIYLCVVILSGLFGAFGKMRPAKKKKYLFFVLSAVFVLMAFRGRNMGNDTADYIALFNRIADYQSPFDYIEMSNVESGFIMYCWLLSKVCRDARILFVVTALIVVVSVGRFAYKYVESPGLFFCLFFGMMQFDFFLSTLRQGISIALLLYALDYLIGRKLRPYVIVCVIAMTFHNSAVMFILLYPFFSHSLMTKRSGAWVNATWLVGAFLCSFFLEGVLAQLLRIFPKYSYYIGTALFDGKARLAVALRIVVCLMLIAFPKMLGVGKQQDVVLDNAGRRLAMMNLLAMILAWRATALMRLASLFTLYTIMQYSNEVESMRAKRANRRLMILLTLVAFYIYGLVLVVMKTPEWQTTYPIELGLLFSGV